MGSSTLAKWIADNIKKDKENPIDKKKPETEKPKKPVVKNRNFQRNLLNLKCRKKLKVLLKNTNQPTRN